MALGFLAKGLLGAGKVVGKGVGLAGRGALMAGRAGMALRGRRKKISPAKLMGREDSVGGGKNVEKGGALMILPSSDLVAYSKGDLSTESRKPNEDVVYTIREKVIEIDKFLKGTVAAEKIEQKKEKQKKEKERRAEREEKLEKPDKGDEDKETPKPLIPQIGFLEGIKQWITKVLVGWLVFNLIKFLPKIMGVLKWIGKIADFVFWLGGNLLNALVTMVHWGYKAFEWTRGAIGNVFGETGLKVFDGITGVLNTVLNLSMSLALAMIALSNEFGTNLLDYAKGFGGIFKHGLARAFPRLLLKLFGKKGAAAILTKIGIAKAGAVATLTKAAAATGTAITGTAKVVGGALTGLPAAVGLLASGLGEGAFQIKKKGQEAEEDWFKRYKEKKWYDPRKAVDWGILQTMKAFNFITGTIGVALDIIGTPFRYLIELVRYPFLSKEGKRKQRANLAKFDARIREQFREIVHAFSFGLLAKDKGAFGSIYGKEGTDEMGYTKDGKTKSQQVDLDSMTSSIEKTEKTFEVKDGKVLEGEKEVVETKQEVSKKPQGLMRGIGGFADFMTMGLTDFDKRGNMFGGKVKTNQKIRGRSGVKADQRRQKPSTNYTSDNYIKIAGERFVPGQPLSEKQYVMIKYGISSGNQYPDEVMKSYKLYETEKNRVKGNSNNIMPLDVNSVSKKINNVSSNASYEDGAEQRIVIPSTSQEQSVDNNQSTGKLVPVAVGGGGGSSEIADALYMGG